MAITITATLYLSLSMMLFLLIDLQKEQLLVWNGKSSLMVLYGSCCNSNAFIIALFLSHFHLFLSFTLSLGVQLMHKHTCNLLTMHISSFIITLYVFYSIIPLQCCVSMPLIHCYLSFPMLPSIVVVYENRLLLFHVIYWSQHHHQLTIQLSSLNPFIQYKQAQTRKRNDLVPISNAVSCVCTVTPPPWFGYNSVSCNVAGLTFKRQSGVEETKTGSRSADPEFTTSCNQLLKF